MRNENENLELDSEEFKDLIRATLIHAQNNNEIFDQDSLEYCMGAMFMIVAGFGNKLPEQVPLLNSLMGKMCIKSGGCGVSHCLSSDYGGGTLEGVSEKWKETFL